MALCDAARQACLSAVSNETNEGDVAVLSTEFSEANSLVMVGVGAQRAPWRCLVSKSGEYVIRVYPMGNDRDTDKTVGYDLDVSIR